MSIEIPDEIWVYRILHYKNLEFILRNGIYTANHVNLNPEYINIGNSEIIQTRSKFPVKIDGYGFVGDYIPFYFGRQSIMLYNILTGHGGLKKQLPEDIIYICCKLDNILKNCKKFFFTDGQANKQFTEHFTDISDLSKIDWSVVNSSDFRKTEYDWDRPRRYQAEFLIHNHVPKNCMDKIVVYNENRRLFINELLNKKNAMLAIEVAKKDSYYFHF